MMNDQKRVLILGSLNEFVSLTKLSRDRGYYTVVCDGYPNGSAKQFADKAYTIDVQDVDAIVELCREEGIDGIVGSFSDVIFEQITKIADRAKLKWYVKPDMLPYYREKNIAKELMQKIGIKTPKSCVLERNFSDNELIYFRFPLVIKPLNGYGSKGVYVVRSTDEIRQRFENVTSFSAIKKIQAEEYINGLEYNITTWLKDGIITVIGLGDREKNPQAGDTVPLLTREVYPSKAYEKVVDEAVDILSRFASQVGQKDGPLAMQFFYNENGVEVCEIAGRLLAFEQEIFQHCSGTNVLELMLDYAFDEEHEQQILANHNPLCNRFCTAIYFVGKNGERIGDINNATELSKDSHVYRYDQYYKEGDVIDHIHGNAYLAAYYISAGSMEELDRVTQDFYQRFCVKNEDGELISICFNLENRIKKEVETRTSNYSHLDFCTYEFKDS